MDCYFVNFVKIKSKMDLKLKIFPALNGDSFLVVSEEGNFLIDGGYVNTYYDFLKPTLIDLGKEGKKLSLVLVTHIDKDHISGIIRFIEENKNSKIITIENVWHNAFRHIQKNVEIDPCVREIFKFPSIAKSEFSELVNDISAIQGSSLASLLLQYSYSWNSQFDGQAVSVDKKNNIQLSENSRIILLSPNLRKLDNLCRFWRKELYKKGLLDSTHTTDFWDDAFEFLLSEEKEVLKSQAKNISHSNDIDFLKLKDAHYVADTSVTNGSSISFILEIDERKILFLADSHSELIEAELRKLFKDDEFPIYFDLVKLSHHGSYSNNSPQLFDMIESHKWVFSTNRKVYNHPDLETIAQIICKKNKMERTLIFNYYHEISEMLANIRLQEKYNYNLFVAKEGEILEVEL